MSLIVETSQLGPFDIFPAIDLLDGQSVRLRKGIRQTAEVVHQNPLAQMSAYRAAGAQWVHVVNLNAAFADDPRVHQGAQKNIEILSDLTKATGLKIQLGGGLRSVEAARAALNLGIDRLVIGTWAIHSFDEVMELVREVPERFVIGVDSLAGKVAVHGWTQTSDETTFAFADRLKAAGVQRVLFTEVERDGLLQGAALEATARLASETGLQVIASGGVKDIADIRQLSLCPGVCGVVAGRSLAAGTLNLNEALAYSRSGS